ncbi:MAG: efflux RND transporter periplasmic adaptor subunit [Gemmatimonadaceae bacterium]|nr:efflux RND transporter periplasmic adaptor subunit [Gemmatimonadaceae bacterium]
MVLSRRTAAIAAAAILLIAAAVVYARARGADAADGSASDDGNNPPVASSGSFATDMPIPVQGSAAVRETLVLSVTAAGQAEAWQRTMITAQVGGQVAGVGVRENDAVAAGRTLLAVNPDEFRLALEEAQAALRTAQAAYAEATILDDRIMDEATRRERDRVVRARTGVDAAEVRVRRAQLDLSRARIAAPFAGRVASIKVVPGQWVRPGDELMTIVALDPIRVEVQVLESEVGFLTAGRSARVTFAAFPGESFSGQVRTVNPLVESGTRTARVTILLANPQGRILPGMYARVALDAQRFPDRVLVPRSALLERDRRPMLFVYEGDERSGLAKWRYVTPGLGNDRLVEILTDADTDSVRPGEVVLTDGHYTLIHDARVVLREEG